jgi:hypothetical protein
MAAAAPSRIVFSAPRGPVASSSRRVVAVRGRCASSEDPTVIPGLTREAKRVVSRTFVELAEVEAEKRRVSHAILLW